MLHYLNSSIFSSPARVLVNTVNTVGVMGKGIALEYKTRYPEMYERYRDLCLNDEFSVGQLWLWKTRARWILNFPTKVHWRNPSRPEYIEAGLAKFAATYRSQGIESISFPLLGCGNGGLDFRSQVQPLMERYLRSLTIPVYIHLRVQSADFVAEHDEPDLFDHGTAPSSFDEFWRDLRQIAERNVELKTFTSGSQVRLAYVTQEHLVFLRGDAKVRIPRDDLWHLWTRLRMTGSVKSADASGRIGREFSLVFPVLAALPYIDRVALSEEFDGLVRNPSIGLQLRFRAPAPQDPADFSLPSVAAG